MVKKKLTKESETLFIPLYGKAMVHKYGDILKVIRLFNEKGYAEE